MLQLLCKSKSSDEEKLRARLFIEELHGVNVTLSFYADTVRNIVTHLNAKLYLAEHEPDAYHVKCIELVSELSNKDEENAFLKIENAHLRFNSENATEKGEMKQAESASPFAIHKRKSK